MDLLALKKLDLNQHENGTFHARDSYRSGIQIQVRNTRVEILPNDLPSLFEKFIAFPLSINTNKGGTGLGVAMLNGQIMVESGHGSPCFQVNLPNLSLGLRDY